MPPTAKLPVSPQFKRGLKAGRVPSDPDRVRGSIPFKPFLDTAKKPVTAVEVDHREGAEGALAAVLGTDTQGTSTVAAALRAAVIQRAAGDDDSVAVPTTQEANSQYLVIAGAGDPGASIIQVLDAWRTKGLKAGGQVETIAGYALLTAGDRYEMSLAIAELKAVVIGMNITRKWYEDAAPGFVWDVTDSPVAAQITVAAVGYTDKGITVAWAGITGTLTWAAYAAQGIVEEAFVAFSADWTDTAGVRSEELRKALDDVRAGNAPVIPTQQTPASPAASSGAATPATDSTTGQTFTGTATMSIMGQVMQVPITGTVTGSAPPAPATNFVAVGGELLTLCSDALSGQWALVAMHFATALQLMGALPSAEDSDQFLSDLGEALSKAAESPDTESA